MSNFNWFCPVFIAGESTSNPTYKEVSLKTAAIVEQPKPMIDEEYVNEFIDYSTKIDDIKSKQLRPLTKAEFDFAVKLLYNDGKVDTEAWHGDSDDLMEKQLTALGYDVSIISNSERWYS